MDRTEIDTAIAGARARFDHADALHDPDVLALIRVAEAMREKLYGPGGAHPMPVFVVKAQDRLAPDAIAAYSKLCLDGDLLGQWAEVQSALAEVVVWQQMHPDLVKTPSHKHVSAIQPPSVVVNRPASEGGN